MSNVTKLDPFLQVNQWSQSVTAIQSVSHTELNCMQSSSAYTTVCAVSQSLPLAISHDLTIVQIALQNFQIKSQVESQHFKSNFYTSNRIAKMVQTAI